MASVDASPEAVLRRDSSGVPGLDEVLNGGFPSHRVHLIQGAPGTGKTTLALQFLLDGARRGERVLYFTLAETAEELRSVASSHGWDISGITLHELAPNEETLRPDEQYTILHPSEVEFGETTLAVLAEVEETKPNRVVFDSLAELRLLARDQLRYRRQILALKQFFAGRRCTVLLLDGINPQGSGLESVAHSVVELEQLAPEYGAERRRMRVLKLRAGRYRGGYHDYVIGTGGITIFPRLVAAEHETQFAPGPVSSGVPELDALTGSGLDRGTSTLLMGPAGTGKSVLGTQYALAAAERGERAAVYIFDESIQTYLTRSRSVGLDIGDAIADGRILLRRLDPSQVSPGEFDYHVRGAAERDGARLIVIDSLNGYLNAMAEERAVLAQLHELLTYLGQRGIATILTMAQHGLVGPGAESPIDVSYLADTVMLLRYFEAAGQIRGAISVVKKRSGPHERTIREFRVGPGIRVGGPLNRFQGILAGSPSYLGSEHALLSDGEA